MISEIFNAKTIIDYFFQRTFKYVSYFNVNIGGCGGWDGAGNWFTGAMDEVAIFHSALKDNEVKAIMKDGFKGMLNVAARGKLAVRWGDVKHEN